jgi:hypothetical protein
MTSLLQVKRDFRRVIRAGERNTSFAKISGAFDNLIEAIGHSTRAILHDDVKEIAHAVESENLLEFTFRVTGSPADPSAVGNRGKPLDCGTSREN